VPKPAVERPCGVKTAYRAFAPYPKCAAPRCAAARTWESVGLAGTDVVSFQKPSSGLAGSVTNCEPAGQDWLPAVTPWQYWVMLLNQVDSPPIALKNLMMYVWAWALV
jgi:hypothetical protein